MREREEYIKDIWTEIILRSAKMLDADFTMQHDIARERAFTEVIGRVLNSAIGILAAAPRVRVLDEWRVTDKDGMLIATFRTEDDANRYRVGLDDDDEAWPQYAPHRVVRVALVEDAALEGPRDQ